MQQTGRRVTRAIVAALGVFAFSGLTAPDAAAQLQPWDDTGYVSINFGYQAGDRTFQESLADTVYGEAATYGVTHSSGSSGLFDIGGGVRVWRNLAAGLAVTSMSTSSGAAVAAEVPHPLFFNRNRLAGFAQTNLEHKQLGIHLHAVWVVPVNEKINVAVSGGPSFFSVDQSLVFSVTPAEIAAPFNTVEIASISTATASESAVGANVGVDVSYKVTEYLGGGIFVRYAGGSVNIPASGGAQSVDVGGVQTGIGLRVRF
jgi:hypothetical protein